MELTITKDIRKESGEVRFPAGATYNFPKDVWHRIADCAGLTLTEFTRAPTELAREAIVGKGVEQQRPANVLSRRRVPLSRSA